MGWALQENDHDTAHVVFREFHARHATYVYDCARRCTPIRLSGDTQLLDVAVANTLSKAYFKAATFETTETENNKVRRHVRAWLGRILQNCIIDELRNSTPIISLLKESMLEAPPPLLAGRAEEDSILAKRLREEIERLPPREQDVLWTYAQHYRPGDPHQRLSNEESRALAERWDTTSVNMRQIRKRAFDKLRRKLTPLLKRNQGVRSGNRR